MGMCIYVCVYACVYVYECIRASAYGLHSLINQNKNSSIYRNRS